MSMVLRLEQIDASMGATVGGKAANLGALTQAGFPVPAGFCVTTAAYREVVGSLLDELLGRLSSAGVAEQAELAGRARELIVVAPVPKELEEALRAAYRELGSPAVAVRSSATAEDLDFASFAGQQDTYLNVVGEEALVDAVRRCWASLWTERAVSYRHTNHIDDSSVALAVVVQEMVQATAAGVMFTANPVTGRRDELVIDASPGLGEAVVSGAVNPDHFVVDARRHTISERRLGDKRVIIRGLPGGGTERRDLQDSSTLPSLNDRKVVELAGLGSRVQDHYGAPQDTEWAIDPDGGLWLTQSRPITTLYPLVGGAPAEGTRVFLCLTLAQGLTRPITPMGLAAFRLIGSSIAAAVGSPLPDPLTGPRAFRVVGQRVFVDFTDVLRNPIGRHAALTLFGVMEARAAAVLKGLVLTPELATVDGSRWSALRRILRVVGRVRAPQRVVLALVSPDRAYRAVDTLEARLREDLQMPDHATAEQRLDHVQSFLGRVFWLMPTVIAYPLGGFALLELARRLLARVVRPGELQSVLRGLPHNVTTEMDLALWQLSLNVQRDAPSRTSFETFDAPELTAQFQRGDLPRVAQLGLTAFLQRYGHRAVAEIDLGMPRWSDDPTHLLSVIANYLRLDDPALAPDLQFSGGNASAEAMIDTLVARAAEHGRLRAGVVRFGLRRARQLVGLRESPKNLLVLAFAGLRHQLALVGQTLVEANSIDAADDVFFLDLTEARQGLTGSDFREVVAQRREAYVSELRRRHIPRILLSDGTEPEAVSVATAQPGALVGTPASAGLVTAPARVILDPVGAQLEPGEILVAPSTDPGWTPLFLTAGGLVMEMGGSNSHGAVVAREYGIPAVVGVPDATSKIRSGEIVTVDGAAGLVQLPEGDL